MFKHVIVERPKPGMIEKLEKLGVELNWYLHDRGWRTYRAWRPIAGEGAEPALFDLGFLRTATEAGTSIAVFEADFETREALEKQLEMMRHDKEVLRITLAAADCVEQRGSGSYIVQQWAPPPPPGRSLGPK